MNLAHRSLRFARSSLLLAPLLAIACTGGPEPRQAADPPLVIHNTAAIVENDHAVTDVQDAPAVLAVLRAPDRLPADRALDGLRQTADVLTYLDIEPGMRVAELASGAGYLTELLARSVGPDGLVYADDPPSLVSHAHIADAWGRRLARPANAGVVRVDRALLPAHARNLDRVYLAFFYSDLPSIHVDRAALDSAVFDALKPGGRFIVIDRRSPVTSPAAVVSGHELHAEESRNARREIEAAGFEFVDEGRFLRSSTDPRDWNEAPSSAPTSLETQDRFLLTFRKR